MNLLIAQMISLKRVQQSIQTLIGQILSEATIRKRPRIHTCFPHLTLCRLSPGISRHRSNRWTCLMPPKVRR
ncbi:hypothetical protein, partial [Thiolapillus sp.]|uniref:hypothetical protein n=1 Tax=Thiolapillus sp. TaxID=2017437 RepID=UPI003AF4E2BD